MSIKNLSHCRGMTLIELMIGMVLGLTLMLGLTKVFVSMKAGDQTQSALAAMQVNGRYGMDIISRDLRRSGYFGGNADLTTIVGSQGVAATNTTCSTADNSWGRMIDQNLFGLDDTNSGYACIPNAAYLRGDVLVVRYAEPATVSSYANDRLYLRSSLFQGRLFKGSEQSSSANSVSDTPQTTRALGAYAYFVGTSSQTCDADGSAIPALMWNTLGDSGTPATDELITGAEHFQVQYGIDSNGDGSVEQYLDAGDVATWSQVSSIRFWLLVRSRCPEPSYDNTNTYSMGDQNYTVADNFRRQVYTMTTQLRN